MQQDEVLDFLSFLFFGRFPPGEIGCISSVVEPEDESDSFFLLLFGDSFEFVVVEEFISASDIQRKKKKK